MVVKRYIDEETQRLVDEICLIVEVKLNEREPRKARGQMIGYTDSLRDKNRTDRNVVTDNCLSMLVQGTRTMVWERKEDHANNFNFDQGKRVATGKRAFCSFLTMLASGLQGEPPQSDPTVS